MARIAQSSSASQKHGESEEVAEIRGTLQLPPLPEHMDGRAGSNRVYGADNLVVQPHLITASTDAEAVSAFLMEYRDQPSTHRAYRKEALRLMKYAVEIAGKPLSSMTRADLNGYRDLLRDPPSSWCGPGNRMMMPGGRMNPKWRPCKGPLSDGSVRYALTACNTLMSWLVEAGYLSGNPLGLMRSRAPERVRQTLKPSRCLSGVLLREIDEALSADDEARWLFRLMRYTGLRLFEAVKLHHEDITSTGDGEHRIVVLGKRKKTREIPVAPQLMAAYIEYQVSKAGGGRAAGPILLGRPSKGQPRPMSDRHGYDLLVEGFKRAARATMNPADARKLMAAEPHDLRRTFITRLLESGAEPKHVQVMVGHSKYETTAEYHQAESRRVRETLRKFAPEL